MFNAKDSQKSNDVVNEQHQRTTYRLVGWKTVKYLKKMGYNVLIVSSEIMAIISLVALFLKWWSPVVSVFLVVLFIAIAAVMVSFSNRVVPYRKPSLKMTTWAIAGIIVLSSFAGVQPVASIKNNILTLPRV